MILVDTSVWIHHFRYGSVKLGQMLGEELVLTHAFVIGELACGELKNRARIFADIEALPAATLAEHEEVLRLVEEHKLWGKGIGWIDSHLLAAALLSNAALWTLDRKLGRAAAVVGVQLMRPDP